MVSEVAEYLVNLFFFMICPASYFCINSVLCLLFIVLLDFVTLHCLIHVYCALYSLSYCYYHTAVVFALYVFLIAMLKQFVGCNMTNYNKIS